MILPLNAIPQLLQIGMIVSYAVIGLVVFAVLDAVIYWWMGL